MTLPARFSRAGETGFRARGWRRLRRRPRGGEAHRGGTAAEERVAQGWRGALRGSLGLLAALLLLLAGFVLPPVMLRQPVYTVLAVADITGSMNARDEILHGATVSRIAMEKAALLDLARRMPCGSRLGVAIFAEERPFVLFDPMEVCGNAAPLRQSIAGIGWLMGWDSESHIAGGLRAAIAAAASRGADLVFITDGQEMPPLSWSAPVDVSALRGRVSGLLVGAGGMDFVPIPKFDRQGKEIGIWRAGQLPSETGGLFKGHEHLTAVNAPHLRALAAASGLTYVPLDDGGLFNALRRAVPRRTQRVSTDLRWVPGGLALLLLVGCTWPWRRKDSSFSKEKEAKRPLLSSEAPGRARRL